MSPLAAASGLPLSSDSSSASCSPLALISSASAYIRPARFEALTLRSGPSSAARAAAVARSTSSGPAKATSQIGSPVAGSMVSNTRPSVASTRSPPMMRGCRRPSTNSRAASESAWAVAVAIAVIVSARDRRPAARSAALDQRQRPDHGCRGDRDAQIPPDARLSGSESQPGHPRRPRLGDGTAEALGAAASVSSGTPSSTTPSHSYELPAPLADHPAHRLGREVERDPDTRVRAARLVPAANLANRLAGERLRESSVVTSAPRAAD